MGKIGYHICTNIQGTPLYANITDVTNPTFLWWYFQESPAYQNFHRFVHVIYYVLLYTLLCIIVNCGFDTIIRIAEVNSWLWHVHIRKLGCSSRSLILLENWSSLQRTSNYWSWQVYSYQICVTISLQRDSACQLLPFLTPGAITWYWQ